MERLAILCDGPTLSGSEVAAIVPEPWACSAEDDSPWLLHLDGKTEAECLAFVRRAALAAAMSARARAENRPRR